MASEAHPVNNQPVSLYEWEHQWQPPDISATETISAEPSRALAGLFDQPSPVHAAGDPLPPLWHWLHFLERPAESDLDLDGHLRDGGFLPPIPHRRRMFAGGRIEITAPLRVGERATRHSRVANVTAKTGRSGELLFVTEEHTIAVDNETRLTEQQDIVYRQSASRTSQPAVARDTAPLSDTAPPETNEQEDPWRLRLTPTSTMLFRFSALTYNAHRIHYDYRYTTQVEGFPDLIVHGPLLAIGLLEPPRRLNKCVRRYEYRLRHPCFVNRPVLLAGTPTAQGADLRAFGTDEEPAVTARAEFA